jgi:hypothetical protein
MTARRTPHGFEINLQKSAAAKVEMAATFCEGTARERKVVMVTTERERLFIDVTPTGCIRVHHEKIPKTKKRYGY